MTSPAPTPLSPVEQLEALRRVQARAEQRIELGKQLFKAAEAHSTRQQTLIHEIKQEQQQLRQMVQEDVARSLQAYDQWVGRMDETFTHAMRSMEERIALLESQWAEAQERMSSLTRRAQTLMEQSQKLLDRVPTKLLHDTAQAMPHSDSAPRTIAPSAVSSPVQTPGQDAPLDAAVAPLPPRRPASIAELAHKLPSSDRSAVSPPLPELTPALDVSLSVSASAADNVDTAPRGDAANSEKARPDHQAAIPYSQILNELRSINQPDRDGSSARD